MAVANRSTKARASLPKVQPTSSVKLLTVEDLEAFPESLPSGPAKYELDHGRLVIMTPPGDEHGAYQLNLAAELKLQGEKKGFGKARAEVAVVLGRDPDTVFGPDAVFIANDSLPIQRSSEGYLETIPDLVVEVRSKNDTGPEVLKKVNQYLDAGVRVVWVADPKKQTITAYRPKRKPKVFTAKDTLTIEDVIPGFQFPVADVFRD